MYEFEFDHITYSFFERKPCSQISSVRTKQHLIYLKILHVHIVAVGYPVFLLTNPETLYETRPSEVSFSIKLGACTQRRG